MDAHAWKAAGTTWKWGGLPVFYRRQGQGEAILCLHGLPTSSWDFEPLFEPLSQNFDLIAPDLLGLGLSAKPRQPLPIGLQADMVEGLLDHEGIGQAHLFTHDVGDTVAQELMARDPEGERWLSVTLLNGGLFPETHRPRPIQTLLASPLGPVIARLSSERVFRKNLQRIFGPDTQPSEEFLRDSWWLLTRDGGRAMLPRWMRYMAERQERRQRWVSPLVEGRFRIRVIAGLADPISGAHMVTRYRELVPEPDVIELPGIGHYPHVEAPDKVQAALLTHLRGE
jgi:pimeloyl-ACP methyl ester carboxylesterase